jgi:DNA-binding beta-propeller fold protein YncE
VTERASEDVVNTDPDHLIRLDPLTLATEMRVEVPTGARDVAVGGGALWVASRGRQTVLRIDPATGDVMRGVGVGNEPIKIAFGADSLWSASEDDTVTRTPVGTGQKIEISVPGKPAGIDVRGDDVWVTALATNQIYHIDARTNEVVGEPIRVCVNPGLLDVTRSTVWVACWGDAKLARVDYRSPA